ncbi:MAG: hypothetical protein JNL94_14350 [Planctomycetes bacterium]|nr:hypothetical protein [Planctomycetota bacterium]
MSSKVVGTAPRALSLRAVAWCAFLVLLPFASGFAQVSVPPVRFDFKPAGIETVPGYVPVHAGTVVGIAGDFGFQTAAPLAVVGEHLADDVVEPSDDDRPLLRGCVRVQPGNEFRVRILPNQKVRLRILIASVPFYFQPGTTHPIVEDTALFGLGVSVSKGATLAPVATGIDLRTMTTKGSLETTLGSYRKVWCTATSDAAGWLRVRFDSTNAPFVPVSAVEVHPFVPLPITYKRKTGAWLSASGSVPGLAEFNAGDFQTAKTKFATIVDPLTRGTAYLWLAGWLDGSELGHSDALQLGCNALRHPTLTANPRAFELLDLAVDYGFAALHDELLGYTVGNALPPVGYGYFNPAVPGSVYADLHESASSGADHLQFAEALYRQIATSLQPVIAHNANTSTDPDFEWHPLGFRSLLRTAVLGFAMNTKHNVYDGAGNAVGGVMAAMNQAETILQAFDAGGFRAQEFAKDEQLSLLCWIAKPDVHQHDTNGGIIAHWDGLDVPSTYLDPNLAWWKDRVAPPGPADPNAPVWAEMQRRYRHAYRNAIAWWVERRCKDGEFGGGPGDDPELVAQLIAPLFALRQASDAPVRSALVDAAETVLQSGQVAGGYFAGAPNDVEHTAEYTSYPLLVASLLEPGSPEHLQRCLETSRLLRNVADPGKAWATLDPSGRLRFRAYWFNNQGPPTTPDVPSDVFTDVPFDGKALIPALLFLQHGRNAMLETDLLSWTAGWRDEALKPSSQRPRGLLPAAVRASDLATGFNGQWWRAGAAAPEYEFPNNVPTLDYLMSGFFAAGHRLGGTDGWSYVVPLVQLLKGLVALDQQLAAGQPPSDLNVVGGKNWALHQLLLDPTFLSDAVRTLPLLWTTPELQVQDDPYEAGTAPYVTPTFLNQARALVKAHSGSYPGYLAEIHTGPDPQNGKYIRKGKPTIEASLSRGEAWLRNFFPLATSLVLFTDRAYLFSMASHETLLGTMTGGDLGSGQPTQIVTWEPSPPTAADLDVAILVNDLAVKEGTTQDRLRVLLWNFESTPRALNAHLWNRMRFGRYAVRIGVADPNTDYFVQVPNATTFDFTQRGAALTFTLQPQTLILLELERTADLPESSLFDFAVGSTLTSVDLVGSTLRAECVVHNCGAVPLPANSARAYASLLAPDGAPVPLGPGITEIEVPLALNHPALPGVNGYALPQATVRCDIPMSPALAALLEVGYSVSFRFTSIAGPDLSSYNDSASVLATNDVFGR